VRCLIRSRTKPLAMLQLRSRTRASSNCCSLTKGHELWTSV
jgi:hypothetical protein